jgi:uncharacterized membrane protein SpoIIM required for sporulation
MRHRAPVWEELEGLLVRVDQKGLKSLDIGEARRFGRLYRTVSSDLVRARTELVDASVSDYLNDLVARSYAHIYAGSGRRGQKMLRFYTRDFPRLFRKELPAIALSTTILLAGGAIGAVFTAIDPESLGVLIPDQHQVHTPGERVADEETTGGLTDGHSAVAFSSFLFTHNIKVTFLVFALGITFGVGTVAVLFYNGVPLGALAMQYHMEGQGLFFWSWILPHGIPELTVIFIAGGAGLVLARGMLMPGRLRRRDAIVKEARTAAKLVVGGMPLLVLAGVIEGTISQMHEPVMPYVVKLVFAGVVGTGVYAYLFFAGRQPDTEDDEPEAIEGET